MQKILTFIVFLTLSVPYAANAQTFGAEEFTLSNGMQAVVIPNHRAPVVTHMIWIKVGGADNAPGKSGMAHYFEHLMFKGTKTMAPGDYSKTVKTLGGNDNAFTGQDYTAYYASVSVDNLPKIMAMEADRMQNLNPPPEHFASEKSVVLEERRQRTENDPRALFAEQMNAALFINHPYATPVVGWMDEIEKYQWDDVKSYYDAWYAPNNAILVVSGDITAAQLKPLAEKYYGAIPQKILPARVRPAVPPAAAQTDITLAHPAIHQAAYQLSLIAPAESKMREDSLALQVLSEILDGGPSTRLYKNIVVDAKKATNVFFRYNAAALDYGRISVGGTPAENVDPKELAALLDAQIEDIVKNGVSEDETREAIQRLQDEAVFARDSLSGPAMIFGAALTTGSSVRDIEHWTDDIAKVTPQAVHKAAQTYLDAQKPWVRTGVRGYLYPAPQITAPQEEASHVE